MRYILAAILALYPTLTLTQPHEHGANDLPDWYDPQCCNLQDCRPVPDSELSFGMLDGAPVVYHQPSGAIFQKEKWKVSQDERYHVCVRIVNPGTENQYLGVYCVYLRAGA